MVSDEFRKMFYESTSIVELAQKMGYKKDYSGKKLSGTYYKEIKAKCQKEGLPYEKFTKHSREDCQYDEKIKELVTKCNSTRDLILKLGLPVDSGTTHRKIDKRIKDLNIDTSHFTGAAWSKGLTRFTSKSLDLQARAVETPWEEAFKNGSTVKNDSLMKRLVYSGKRIYICSTCGIDKWNCKYLRLRLDHIDGNNLNNCEDNLRFLCPNCDSQTNTFCRGANRPKNSDPKWWENICPPNQNRTLKNINREYKRKNKASGFPKEEKNCIVCNVKFIGSKERKYCSQNCLHFSQRKVARPSIEVLKDEINKGIPWLELGKKYKVSDKAVVKWAKSYGIYNRKHKNKIG